MRRSRQLPVFSLRKLTVTGVAVMLLVVGAARAQEGPGAGTSATQQYVEALPSGSGQTVPGLTASTTTALPAVAVDALNYVPPSIADVLREIATSSDYGAPKLPEAEAATDPGEKSPASAVWRSVESIGSASDTRLLASVAVLVAITAVAGALAAGRARR